MCEKGIKIDHPPPNFRNSTTLKKLLLYGMIFPFIIAIPLDSTPMHIKNRSKYIKSFS